MDLTNAAAIVTGGAGGVGSATVRRLAQMGATVVIAAVSAKRGKPMFTVNANGFEPIVSYPSDVRG